MNIAVNELKHLLKTAFSNTLIETKKRDAKNKSSKWIEFLSHEFKKKFNNTNIHRVFSKYDVTNRNEFKLNELLFDIHVCKVAKDKNKSQHKKYDLLYIVESLWQVESEFNSSNRRDLLIDFSKLVVGSGINKLFITTKYKKIEYLFDVALNCSNNVYLCVLPDIDIWAASNVDSLVLYKRTENSWKLIS